MHKKKICLNCIVLKNVFFVKQFSVNFILHYFYNMFNKIFTYQISNLDENFWNSFIFLRVLSNSQLDFLFICVIKVHELNDVKTKKIEKGIKKKMFRNEQQNTNWINRFKRIKLDSKRCLLCDRNNWITENGIELA